MTILLLIEEPIAELARYGVLGIIATALALFAKRAYEREVSARDRVEKELRETQSQIVKDIVPLLTRAVIALEKLERINGRTGYQ